MIGGNTHPTRVTKLEREKKEKKGYRQQIRCRRRSHNTTTQAMISHTHLSDV